MDWTGRSGRVAHHLSGLGACFFQRIDKYPAVFIAPADRLLPAALMAVKFRKIETPANAAAILYPVHPPMPGNAKCP